MIRFRIKNGNTEGKCTAAFGTAQIIKLDNHRDEFALVTEKLEEGEIKAKLDALGEEVLSFIRMEG